MFGNVTCVSPLGTLVSRVLFLVSAYLHIFCSFWINFSLLLFLIIMYCSCFLGPSSCCSEMCTLNPAIFVFHKLYNGISFSSCLGCLIQSCHVFLFCVLQSWFWGLFCLTLDIMHLFRVGLIWGTSASLFLVFVF